MQRKIISSSLMGVFLCLAGLCMFLAGCAVPAENGFNTVAGYLESGGSYYRISDQSNLYQTGFDLFKSFEHSLLNNQASADTESKMLKVSLVEYLIRLAGISDCRWCGASSVRIPDALEPTFRNRSFYLLPENASGELWRLPGTKNRPLLNELTDLPADTEFAGDFILDLRSLGMKLEKSKLWSPEYSMLCRSFFGVDLSELCSGISGEWGIVMFPYDEKNHIFNIVLTLPDHKNRFFHTISRFAATQGGKCDAQTVYFEKGTWAGVSCVSFKDRITIFTSQVAREKFLSSETKLASQPDFKRLSANMPEEGLAVFYWAGSQPESQRIVLPEFIGGSVDASVLERSGFTVVRREKEGLSIISHQSFDYAGDLLASILQPVLLVLSDENLWKPYFSAPVPVENDTNKQVLADQENFRKQCEKNMLKISAALKAFAEKNKTYPAAMDIAGIRQLVDAKLLDLKDLICPATKDRAVSNADMLDFNSCSYLYFGAWPGNSSGKLPLVIDLPNNHLKKFHILFNDGSVEFVELDNCNNIRRVVGFLHTKYNYTEDEFRILIKRASELDILFEAQ